MIREWVVVFNIKAEDAHYFPVETKNKRSKELNSNHATSYLCWCQPELEFKTELCLDKRIFVHKDYVF